MIEYEKRFGAFNLLFRVYGAQWQRAALLAAPSTVLALLLAGLADSYIHNVFQHPHAYAVFGSLVAFLLIFRTQLSYARYWEGRSMVGQMSSKWGDAVIQVITFDEAAEELGIPGGLRFRSEFVHTMSLMHALAIQSLRGDTNLDNLRNGSFWEIPPPPPVDAYNCKEWQRVRGRKSLFFLRGRKHEEKYFRCCTLDVVGGLNPSELSILRESDDRVFLVMCWLHRLLVARRMAGGIREDAPIVSRIYQVLSDGMLGYTNALKLTTTPFPFPFAQSVAILLHINALLAPLLLARWAGPLWLVVLMTFITVFACYLLNEVSREIEEPFKYDPNDLPVVFFQHQFNQHLVTAFVKSLFPHHPDNDPQSRDNQRRQQQQQQQQQQGHEDENGIGGGENNGKDRDPIGQQTLHEQLLQQQKEQQQKEQWRANLDRPSLFSQINEPWIENMVARYRPSHVAAPPASAGVACGRNVHSSDNDDDADDGDDDELQELSDLGDGSRLNASASLSSRPVRFSFSGSAVTPLPVPNTRERRVSESDFGECRSV